MGKKGMQSLVRLVASANEEHLDTEIRHPDGKYVATRCGQCKGYRRDVIVGPFRGFLRGTSKFCRCPPDNRATQRLSDEELAATALAALGVEG